jgi:soluble lytic murein transglycosylase-like protein
MRYLLSFVPGNAILAAWAALGIVSPGAAYAAIYGSVEANGTIVLTNMPEQAGQAGLSVVVAGEPPTANAANSTKAASPGENQLLLFADVIEEASRTFRIEPQLLRAVIDIESKFNPKAVSNKGAKGLMQLMPETARRFSGGDMFNPRENVLTGARYLRFLLDLFKEDIELTLAAYNAGENAVIRAGYRIPSLPETRKYVPRVLERYRRLLSSS